MTVKTVIAAAAIATLSAAAQAHSDDAAFDRVGRTYAAGAQSTWHNALRPEASGDYVAVAQDESADAAMNRLAGSYSRGDAKWLNALLPAASGDYVMVALADTQFMRQVAFYTRDMLDRGGWVNAFIADDHYAAGNVLLAARVGEGVTSRVV
jgi:hypothetical protein